MEVTTDKFIEGSRTAIKDEHLQKAIHKATSLSVRERDHAAAEIPDWEELREKARNIKQNTIERLDEYLALLADSVEKAGGTVFWADTAEDATRYITDLAVARGVKTVVKGKSMTSEEIGLNERFEELGIEPVETDLGEYIVQMAKEKPFHIIAPAIHKTRQDIGQLFADKLDIEYEDNPEKLTKIAREKLRGKFCDADMGVTGVNFGIAETGTVVVVENEGNGRLSTSMPPVYVALMGMEKVIPALNDLSTFMTLLPRSATGQKASCYVSFITGTRNVGEVGGPKEFHLVILDNGRSRILQDPEMRESLFCIRCGACLNICPIYNKVGGHSYGWVYSGPIGAVITPQYVGLDKAKDLPNASTLCGACRDICPLRINIPHMLLNLRHKIAEGDKTTGVSKPKSKWAEKAIIDLWVIGMKSQRVYGLGHRVGLVAQKVFLRNSKMKDRLPLLSGWTEHRELPPLAPKPFRDIWKERLSKNGG